MVPFKADFLLRSGLKARYDQGNEFPHHVGVLLFGFEPDWLLLTSSHSARRLESHP